MPFFQTPHLRVDEAVTGIADLVLDRRDVPINYLDLALIADLGRALDAIGKAGRHRLLVLRSAKKDLFCHGLPTDLIQQWDADQFDAWAQQGQALCRRLVELPVPTVAIIAGGCFDSGLELALACDYRIVINRPATMLGFPELEWGLVPSWGATQRLPRLTGLENSLHMLLGGVRHGAREAWKCGLADHLVEPDDEEPPGLLLDPRKRDWSTFPRRNWRERYLESNRWGRWFLYRGAERILRTRIPEEMPAPVEMLTALRLAHPHPTIDAGLAFERQALRRVIAHPALHHMVRLLHHREALRPAVHDKPNRVQQLGIIGAGVPALALLLQAVRAGQKVVLRTADESTLGFALAQVVQVMQAEVQRGAMSPPQLEKLLGAVRGTHTWKHFDQLDAVIDTTDGPVADKQALFKEMEAHLPATALIVAAPTSFRIADLHGSLQRPMRLLGLRIIEPWNRGSLAEIVTTASTASGAIERLRDWATSLEKFCIAAPDQIGGLVMRIWLPALNEAGLMLRDGLCVEVIDDAMRRFGMTQGPFEWMDRLGLDQVAALIAGCQPRFQGRIQFESGFTLMAERGWLGNQTDVGFYTRAFRGRKPDRSTELLWRTSSKGEQASAIPVLSRSDLQHWIQRRFVTLTVLEAVRCLDEGIIEHADDLDCALCLTGWAMHRGGPIGYGQQLGHGPFAALCAELAHLHGQRFTPPPTLGDHLD